MRPKRFLPPWLLATGLAFPAVLPVSHAALYWDGTSTGPNADGGAGTWNSSNTNWDTAATGGTDWSWVEAANAVFGGSGGSVTVSGSVTATSLTFQSPGYSLTGGFIGFQGNPGSTVIATGANDVTIRSNIWATSVLLSKTGAGTLTLSGSNGLGTFHVEGGTLKSGGNQALGIGYTVVKPGATADLNGTDPGSAFIISGAGVGGAGAIVNNHATTAANINQPVTLTGPATLGGTRRWNLSQKLDLDGDDLTKVGASEVHLTGSIINPGNIDIKEGGLWFQADSGIQGSLRNKITVRQGAMFGQSSNNATTVQWSLSFEPGSTWRAAPKTAGGSGAPNWFGPISLAGATTIDVLGSTMLRAYGSAVMSGAGSVTKTGPGTFIVQSTCTYSGGTTVDGGTLILRSADVGLGGGTLRGPLTMNSGTTLILEHPLALGSAPGMRVTPLNVNNAVVETLFHHAHPFDAINLKAATLRTRDGENVPDDPALFQMLSGSAVNVLPASTSSVISGRIDLGPGPAPSVFHVEDGHAREGLRVEAAISGDTPGQGMIKSGAGLMLMEGPSVYTGPTTVAEGALLLGQEGSLPSSLVTVKPYASFGTAHLEKTLPGMTLEPTSRIVLPLKSGNTTVISGNVELAGGNIVVSPILGSFAPGVYDLATAAAITGTGTPVLDLTGGYGPTRATGSVAVNGNKLQLTLTGIGGNLVWNNGGQNIGAWDNVEENFLLGGNNTAFHTYDSVTFNDTVAPGFTKTVNLSQTLVPSLVTVDNSSGDYVFNGTDSLTGLGSLVKTGTSNLILGATGTYSLTGDITAAGGAILFGGPTLQIDKLTLDGGNLSDATATVRSADFRSGSSNALLTGDGPWTKTTTGTVVLSADNELDGPGVISEGTLFLGEPEGLSSTGKIGNGPIHIAAGASMAVKRSGYHYVENALSGPGELALAGVAGASFFFLPNDNSNFSGSLTLTNASLLTSTIGLGTAAITVKGSSVLSLPNAVLGNTIRLDPAPWVNPPPNHLVLEKTVLNGPLVLAAGGTSVIKSFESADSSPPFENIISGPITDSGGPASLILHSGVASPRNALVLSGNSHYTGTTTIRGFGGLTKLDGSLGGSAVTVESNAALGGTGTIHAGGSLAFAAGGRLMANLSGEALRVEGNVDLGPSLKVHVDIANAATTPGPVPVLEYTGSLSGNTAQVALGEPSLHRQAVFSFTPGLVTLDIGRKTVIWKGNPGQLWEAGGSVKRWKSADNGQDEFFYKGDSVIFDDSAVSTSVTTTDFMWPAAMLVDNTAKDMSISAQIWGPSAITKRGSGKLSLLLFNSHTGGTFVEAGRLEARDKSLGYGPVVVSPGATLAGDVQFPGPLTLQGILDPGLSSSTASADMTAGPTTLSGTYRCLLHTTDSDTLVVEGDLDLTGSTLALTKSFTGINHPEDFLIAVYTGNLTGSFATITGMPDDFHLVHDAVNKRFHIRRLPFSNWIANYPGLSDTSPEGDPDNDGFANLVEYVIGGNPGSGDASTLQAIQLNGNQVSFSYKRRDSSLFDTIQHVQYSSTLEGPWNNIGIPTSTGPDVTVIPNGDFPDDITVTLPRQPDRMFFRLMVMEK